MNLDAPSTGKVATLYTAWLILTTGGALLLVGDLLGPMVAGALVMVVAVMVGTVGIDTLVDLDRNVLGVGVALAALGIVCALALAAMTVAVPGYHAAYGQRTDANVTATHTTEPGSDPSYCRLALTTTEREVGWIRGPRCAQGDHIEVSVDPRGWVRTIPADQVATSRTGLVVVLALLLAALGTVIAAITATVLDHRGW